MDGTGGQRRLARRAPRRLALLVVAAATIAACDSASSSAPTTTVGPAGGSSKYSLTLQWQLGGAPITRSLFLRRGTVIAAGERTRGASVTESVIAVDSASGTLKWEHPLRAVADDPQSLAFQGQTLRIVAAEEGVYVSSYGGGGIKNPIVGFAIGTGARLFPDDDKVEASLTSEEVVGAVASGLVTSAGVVRDPATGVVKRLRIVGGTVLAIAGSLAFAWDGVTGTLTGYDIPTDQARWTVPMPIRPTVVLVDEATVLLASSEGWRRLDLTTGAADPLEFEGVVDPLSTFDTCAGSDFQSVPVGRYSSPISCDATHVAASLGDRVQVYDLAAGSSVRIAVCDPDSDPFSVSGELFVCATEASNGKLSIRLIDAASGFEVLDFSDDRAAPVGLLVTEDQVIVSLEDGSLVAYRLTR